MTQGLLNVIEYVLPMGSAQWENVAIYYNSSIPGTLEGKPNGVVDRDMESLRNKFKKLKNTPKPTGMWAISRI